MQMSSFWILSPPTSSFPATSWKLCWPYKPLTNSKQWLEPPCLSWGPIPLPFPRTHHLLPPVIPTLPPPPGWRGEACMQTSTPTPRERVTLLYHPSLSLLCPLGHLFIAAPALQHSLINSLWYQPPYIHSLFTDGFRLLIDSDKDQAT